MFAAESYLKIEVKPYDIKMTYLIDQLFTIYLIKWADKVILLKSLIAFLSA